MKKYYLLPMFMFMFFVSNGQELKIIKNNYELVKVDTNGKEVDLTYVPVNYLMKDVELYEKEKLTLSPKEYSNLVSQLQYSLKNKEDLSFKLGENNIEIDFSNSFCFFSKTKLGTRIFDYEESVRFSINGQEYSVSLTKKELKKMIV